MTDIALAAFNRTYRRVVFATPVAGLIGLVVSIPFGHPIAGAMWCVGLALGFLNSRLVIGSMARFSATEGAPKRRLGLGVLKRLAVITVVALGLAVLLRPDGFAVLAGLAVFQLLLVLNTSGPLMRVVRRG